MPESPDVNASEQYVRIDHLTDSIGGRTARGGLVTILTHGCKFAISIVATAILARLLTPADYGLIAMVAVVTNFVAIFKDMGLSLATIQRAEISNDQVSTLFWVNVALSIGIMLLMVAIAPLVGWFYGEPRLLLITIVTAAGFVVGGVGVQHEALLKRQMKFVALSVIAFTSMTVGYLVGILLAWMRAGYWALVFSQLALLASNTAGVWLTCRWRPGKPTRHPDLRSILSFGGNVTGYSLINYASKNVDNLLIGRLMGRQELGLYGKAVQVAGLPTEQINDPVGAVTIPALSRLAQTPERYRQAYLRITEKVIMFAMPAVALMIVSADWLVRIVLGPQWGEAAPILVCLGVAGLFQPVMATGGWLLVTQGRTRDMLRWSLINAPISIISIIVGLKWGALGVAASYSVGRLFIANPLMFWFVGRTGPVHTKDFYLLLTPFTCASGAAVLAGLLFRKFWIISSPLMGFVSSAVVVGVATLLVLCLLPRGRAALMDLKHSLLLLRPIGPAPTTGT